MKKFWCNGHWLPAENHPGTAHDRGAVLGLGLFETLLAIHGVPVFVDRHLARLKTSAASLGWSVDLPDLRELAGELLAKNHLTTGRARVRLTVTGGSGPLDDLRPGADRLIWLAASAVGDPPESLAACLSPWPRNERSPLAGLKCASYAENLIALDHARQRGFDEILFPNTAGHLAEFATANLFLVKNGTLRTPALTSGCLPGICRAAVIELAGTLNLPLEQAEIPPSELSQADEIFLTSALRGVIALSRFEDRILGPAPVTAQLRQALHQAIATEISLQTKFATSPALGDGPPP